MRARDYPKMLAQISAAMNGAAGGSFMTGHGIETVSGMPTTGSLGSQFGAITDSMSFSTSIMQPAMGVNDPRLVNPMSFANSISDNAPSAEERITTQLRIRTVNPDQGTSDIQLQKGDWLFVKADDKDNELRDMLVLLTRAAAGPTMLDETQREGVNLAQLNKHLLLKQLDKLSKRTDPWNVRMPDEYYIGQRQLKSACHVYNELEYRLSGLIHADGTEAGFAPHAFTSGQAGAFTPIDNNYIFDVVHKGHGYTTNYFGPSLGCGSRLFFVLMPILMQGWRKYNFRDALAYDHNVTHVEFDRHGAPVFGGRDRTKYYNPHTANEPYERQRWQETGQPFPDRAAGFDSRIPDNIVVYQMVAFGASATDRIPPIEAITLQEPGAKLDAVVLPIARMRHGYTMRSSVYDDSVNHGGGGINGDSIRMRTKRSQNYQVQRECKQIECLVTPVIQPIYLGQTPLCHS